MDTIPVGSDSLERYSFIWSEIRLGLAAIALLLGGVPVVRLIFPFSPLVFSLLVISWVVSGVASGYLLYRWFKAENFLFGKNISLDTAAFFVSIVSGLNLGIAGIIGQNIGMLISSSRFIFLVVAIIYVASAYHLWRRWKDSGEKVFLPRG